MLLVIVTYVYTLSVFHFEGGSPGIFPSPPPYSSVSVPPPPPPKKKIFRILSTYIFTVKFVSDLVGYIIKQQQQQLCIRFVSFITCLGVIISEPKKSAMITCYNTCIMLQVILAFSTPSYKLLIDKWVKGHHIRSLPCFIYELSTANSSCIAASRIKQGSAFFFLPKLCSDHRRIKKAHKLQLCTCSIMDQMGRVVMLL